MTTPRRGQPAPPVEPRRGRDWRATPVTPPVALAATPSPPQRTGWWRAWWIPVTQLVALSAIVLTGSAFIDDQNRLAAADLAADRGAGRSVAVARPAIHYSAPVSVSIARIGVRSSLVDLRKNPNGTVQVPADFGRAGWYVGSAHPGDAGPTVLIGHVDSKKGPGVFYRVAELHKGDRITVARADRSTAVFVVQAVRRVPKSKFPTALVYKGDGRPSLRLVTCGGQFDRRTGHYLDNTVVLAVPAPPAPPKRAPAVKGKPRTHRAAAAAAEVPRNHRLPS